MSTALCILPLLSACGSLGALKTNADETLHGVQQAMSGDVLHPAAYVNGLLEDVKEVRSDIERRVDNVSEGIDALQRGHELIRAGLSASGALED